MTLMSPNMLDAAPSSAQILILKKFANESIKNITRTIDLRLIRVSAKSETRQVKRENLSIDQIWFTLQMYLQC